MSEVQTPTFEEDSSGLESLATDETLASVIEQAADMGASDLFLMTVDGGVEISVRHWGEMKVLDKVSLSKGQQLISALKAAAGMDIAEKRRPMDGRFTERFSGRTINFRVSCLPTLHGEDLSMRLLDHLKDYSIDSLGMLPRDLDQLIAMLNQPSGLILVSGPTGAGKTTTLYSCLAHLNDGKRKINTLEDPIEYAVPGLRQSQVHAKLGLDFAELLRSVLRQAPDVIMIGEVRDEATAQTAVRAANCGHLVFATLHAPVAAAAVQSMLTLGGNPRFMASCIVGVIAQRLVRTLCKKCRVVHDLSLSPATFSDVEDLLGPDDSKSFYAPGGCEACGGDGYSGRTGLFEVVTFSGELRKLVAQRQPTMVLQEAAIKAGMTPYRRSAMVKVAQGVTSMEEVLAEVPGEYLGITD